MDIKEEKCKCGADIPMGFGYYNYCKEVICVICGKTNQRKVLIVDESNGGSMQGMYLLELSKKYGIPYFKNIQEANKYIKGESQLSA